MHQSTTSFPGATATYVPKRLSTPGSIKFWKSSIDHLVAYLEDKKLLHFALQVSIRERLGAEVDIANPSEAYLLPKLENCDDMELLFTFRGYAFEEHFSAVDVAESAIVGRLFYLATTHGLPTAATNLLDMSTLIAEWVTSKQAKLRALSLLACNFGHLQLAGLACLTEIVQLACLLGRLINFGYNFWSYIQN